MRNSSSQNTKFFFVLLITLFKDITKTNFYTDSAENITKYCSFFLSEPKKNLNSKPVNLKQIKKSEFSNVHVLNCNFNRHCFLLVSEIHDNENFSDTEIYNLMCGISLKFLTGTHCLCFPYSS